MAAWATKQFSYIITTNDVTIISAARRASVNVHFKVNTHSDSQTLVDTKTTAMAAFLKSTDSTNGFASKFNAQWTTNGVTGVTVTSVTGVTTGTDIVVSSSS